MNQVPKIVRSLILVFSLTGCTVRLAPRFNQTIVDDLSSSSTEVLTLLAAANGGTTNTTYANRTESYNSVIGQLEALELEIEARPMPKNKTLTKIIAKANSTLSKRNRTPITANDQAPSATAVQNIISNVVKMKSVDSAQGLRATEVKTFKGFVVLYLDQAITYESYLTN